MRFFADLHIHSKYSRATSPELDLEHLWLWAQIKGISVVSTGDCVHPGWFKELSEKLSPCGNGLFELKREFCAPLAVKVPPSCTADVRFILSSEISNIYKRDGKVRKVHNVVYLPDFPSAEKFAEKLGALGNIRSDGRPILGLDSRDLLEILLSCNPDAFLVPAHVWTPWFSALGSKSGFDSIEECFGDLTKYIYALETGLSSDPAMNWRLSSLDPFALVSNSDAHSPAKLGREANIFDTELSYNGILDALRKPADKGLAGTVEFFPEEGKYHFDGHRKCETRMHPRDTIRGKGLCPVCGKPVTVGVMARVEQLADRPEGEKGKRWRPYHSMIPLAEIIGDCLGVGPASQKAEALYWKLAGGVGNEFFVLMDAPLDGIRNMGGSLLSEGVRRVRNGEITIKAGYDGEYGTIKIFSDKERSGKKWQESLFGDDSTPEFSLMTEKKHAEKKSSSDAEIKKKAGSENDPLKQSARQNGSAAPAPGLNSAQAAAVHHPGKYLFIIAGPGTGKTHTLVHRIAETVRQCAPGEKILALTFTNKAAGELRERIVAACGKHALEIIFAGTFHRFCLDLLREYAPEAGIPADFAIASEDDRIAAAARAWPSMSRTQIKIKLDEIFMARSRATVERNGGDVDLYMRELRLQKLLDFDDLLAEAVNLLSSNNRVATRVRNTYRHVFADEYQDINAVQHEILANLVRGDATFTAIGDPNQAIYGFRGSNVRFFGTFGESFPGATTLFLSENYRTAPNLLEACGHVIGPGNDSKVRPLTARLLHEGKLLVHEAATDKAEAEFVVHQIERLVGGTSMFSHDSGRVENGDAEGRSFGDCAVLYRTNAQSAPLVEAFERSGIPYQVSGELALREYPFVKDMLDVLSSANANVDDPRIPPSQLRVLRLSEPAMNGVLEKTASSMKAAGVLGAIESMRDHPDFGKLLDKDKKATELFERLVRIARLHGDFRPFMDHILLQQSEDAGDLRAEKVSLLTLHAAKGLEFPVVFITGCEQGLLPLVREGKESDAAEERRLFYVGMTRAKERLYLTYARRRVLYGRMIEAKASPFLSDIKEELKAYEKTAPMKARKAAESEQTELFGETL
jgi:DNA helicase II / ATP-dependent DNA helicase PcrA